MPTNKRITDLTDYTSVLPYASELFGVYQPMIGWKSKRTLQKMKRGIIEQSLSKFRDILAQYEGIADVKVADISHDQLFYQLLHLKVGIPKNELMLKYQGSDSVLFAEIASQLKQANIRPNSSAQWKEFINEENIDKLLVEKVYPVYEERHKHRLPGVEVDLNDKSLALKIITALKVESAIARVLIDLLKSDLIGKLDNLFFVNNTANKPTLSELFKYLKEDNFEDPFKNFDPNGNIKDSVCISPIGIVHLYRQYFFELDTFLGTPVSHVWMSPGSSVELIETSSRKHLQEKSIETFSETTIKEESSSTEKDELSDAIKTEDKKNMKLGFSATANQSWGSGNFSATGSLNMDNTQQTAREEVHKKMSEQTKKLSKEIRNSFKSTFKTITETTDTQSKRYVLNNSTKELINYELRRKMRQVGVQVQDIGSYLCWQTFIDDPGQELGLPNLIHIAKVTDIDGKPEHPAKPVLPEAVYKDYQVQIPFIGTSSDNDDKGELYENGKESNNDNSLTIKADFEQKFGCEKPNYLLDTNSISITTSDSVDIAVSNKKTDGSMLFFLKSVHFNNKPYVTVGVRLKWIPDPAVYNKVSDAAIEKYKQELANYTEKALKAERNDYVNAVKDRVTLASSINKRKFEDLREEERTIVYRNLIKALMTEKNYKVTGLKEQYQTQHILSELINAVFDIDKMLYFVAPEWWRARKHTKVSFGDPTKSNMIEGSIANWSSEQKREDDYLITEKSMPAPLGSSLGWLLQLDGDDLRNAFLNAPWVKTVIPIRPGKEKVAINWLEKSGVEGSDGLDANYPAATDELIRINVYLNTGNVPKSFSDAEWETVSETTAPNPVTIRQAIEFLCAEVAFKEETSKKVSKYPKEEINDDNKVLATPIEKVFEHGFYPLKGGFKAKVEDDFEITSQWIEVLPTDQVVPVEVKYDPKTGRQI
jgi:mRNA-degrading endonuclease RelE of RelBE toxin-antitoxin system